MQIRILGSTEVARSGGHLALTGAKRRELLTLLAMRPNVAVPAQQLIDELWQSDAPPSAATALRVHMSRIRKVLQLGAYAGGDLLTLGPHGYVLQLDADAVDAFRFERLVRDARERHAGGDASGAARVLDEALGLWRGPALADARHLAAAQAEAARLDDVRAGAVEVLADARLSLGEHAQLIDVLVAAVDEFPLRERLTAELMLALYRSGRQADALAAYRALARRLDEMLGVVASPELRRLEEDILLQRPGLDAVARRPATVAVDLSPWSTFVGRRDELARLSQACARAADGERRLVRVSGPPGIGKSTFVEEYARRATASGGLVLAGRCEPEGGDYRPMGEIVQGLVDYVERAGRTDQIAAQRPELARLLPELAGHPERRLDELAALDAQAERLRLFDAVTSCLVATETNPVLVVEDAHWIDRGSLALLRHLLRKRRVPRLLVVVTFRDDELSGDRADALAHLAPPAYVDDIVLGGLSDAELRRYLGAVAARDLVPRLVDAAAHVRQVTGGNPFFVRELVRELEAFAPADGPEPDIDDLIAAVAPAGVRALIDARLSRLSPAARRALRAAAVLRHDITEAMIAQVSRTALDEALDAVDECLAARLMIDDPSRADRVAFPHELVHNAVYASIAPARRAVLHARAVGVLASMAAGEGAHVAAAEIARHAYLAVPRVPGADAAFHCERAGEEAVARLAFGDAAVWCARAVELDPNATRCLALARALEAESRFDEARDAYVSAAAAARDDGDPVLLADVAIAASSALTVGSRHQQAALSLVEDALAGLPEAETSRRVQLLERVASASYYADPDRERRAATEALAIAERTGDTAAVAAARLALHRSYTHVPEARGERLALSSSARALLAGSELHAGLRLRITRVLLGDLLENGCVDELQRALSEYETEAAELRSPRDIYWAMVLRATHATMLGDLDLADQLVRGAARQGAELEQLVAGAEFLQTLVVRFQQGRLVEIRSAMPPQAPDEDQALFQGGLALIAVVHAETGELERALRYAWRGVGPDGRMLTRDVLWLGAMCLFGGVAAAGDDRSLNELVSSAIAPCADHVVVFGTGGAVLGTGHHWLGVMATARGHHDLALDHLDEACALSDRLGARFWAAQARIDMARALLLRDHSGDAHTARALVEEALETAEAYGYGRITQCAERLS